MKRTPMKRSRGTVIPPEIRLEVHLRDDGCVGFGRFPGPCGGALETDHVRAGGMGMKSRTETDNLVSLCQTCHRWKTEHGRVARAILLDYLERVNA